MVGVRRFELRASWSQTKRSDLAELHPEPSTEYTALNRLRAPLARYRLRMPVIAPAAIPSR